MSKLGSYFRELYSHWLAAWSGTVALIVALALWASGTKELTSAGFAVAAFICLVIASFQMWSRQQNRIIELQNEKIGGPELIIGFETNSSGGDGPLCVINHKGGGLAHSVTLRIPLDDGQTLVSKPINILRDDDTLTSWEDGEGHRILCADLIMNGGCKGYAFVTCMDGDGTGFEYDFEPLPKLAGYRFVAKHRTGRANKT